MVIGIVEDDLFFQEELVSFLYTLSDIEDISVFAKGEDFLNSADNLNLDVLFLDIGLPDASGVEVAKCIRRGSPLLDIVFITADDSYIKDAFQLYASDYIEKPLNSERLKTTLERIRSRLVGFNQRIELKIG